jgi:ATP/maltotriose-dependent transcriptional regulator MalT/DNA-binding SARP family transcriptional activator
MIQPKLASLAKLTQPSSAGTFPRRRLFHLIDKKLSHPVLWITGPPGSGKTTLISSYLAAHGLSCLWYQVDGSDGDIASFFYYMGLAAKKASPHKRQSLPLLTPEYLKDVPTFTRRYFETLYGRLLDESLKQRRGETEQRRKTAFAPPPRVPGSPVRFSSSAPRASDSPTQFVIVLDNYQEAPEGSSFHEIIRQGLSEVPAGINVILISRRDPPGLFARMRANRHLGMIDWDELRFNFDESKRMIHHRGYKRLSNELLRRLHERTEGWAAGLVLLTEGMKSSGAEPLLSKADVPDEIFHYFAGEIFNKTNRETQDFLLKTAVLLRMTPQMAEALTGHSQAKRILSDLSQKNYFTQKHESHAVFYQYHPLFREFLQAQAKENFGSVELSEIEHRASAILAENGQIEDAADLMVKTGNWSALVPLILESAPALISQGRNQTLDAWIGNLPQPLAEENPWLLYWEGVCRLPFSPTESGDIFKRAFGLFRARREAVGVFLSLSGLFDSTTYGMGDFKAYDQWIDLLKEVGREYKTYPSEEIETRLTASVTFAIIARQPEQSEFEEWVERALSLVKRSPDISVKTRTLQALASHYIFAGNLSKAMLVIDSFQEVAQSPNLPPLLVILLKNLEAMYYWMSASFEECRKAATRGLDLASSTGVHLWDNYLLGHAAAGALSAGDMAEARGLLQRMSSSLGMMPTWGKEYYHVLAAWASFVRGDQASALSHIESCLALSAETGMLLTKAFDHLGKALILIELKREKEAQDQINRVQAMAQSFKAPLVEFTCLLAQTRLALDTGDEASGLESLRKAMVLGKEQGYANTFFWHAPMMANLCKRALDAAIEVDFVQHLIRKRGLFPDPPPYDCERWPWPLKIFTLGTFDLAKEGEPLEFPVKAPRKMLSLLKVLVAFGSKGLSEEQLTAALWPEADGDMAHQAFATTLHRLRQLLGNEKAIQLRRGLLRFDGRYCWVDAHAFEYLREQADVLDDMALLQKAVALYKGPFLGGDDSEPWAISYQERLRSKFLRAVTKLGQVLEKNGTLEKAIEWYRKGLEVDGLAEEFYQHLMLCYQSSGRKAEAIAVYDRCRDTLRLVLGVEPSPHTQSIYETLRKTETENQGSGESEKRRIKA